MKLNNSFCRVLCSVTHKTSDTHFVSEDVPSDDCSNLNKNDQEHKDGKLGGNERYLSDFNSVTSIQPLLVCFNSYHGDHAVVLFPGTTAAEEGD